MEIRNEGRKKKGKINTKRGGEGRDFAMAIYTIYTWYVYS